MGRPRIFQTSGDLRAAWELYKTSCDHQSVLTHEFSAKNSEFVSKQLRRSVTYTIEGFCVFVDMSRSAFYSLYAEEAEFLDIVTRMREECEVDARRKFETGAIPSQLAALWMSKHGYSARTESSVSGRVAVTDDPYDGLTSEELRALARACADGIEG